MMQIPTLLSAMALLVASTDAFVNTQPAFSVSRTLGVATLPHIDFPDVLLDLPNPPISQQAPQRSVRKSSRTFTKQSQEPVDLPAAIWSAVATCDPSERHAEVLDLPAGASLPEGLDGTYYVNGLASCEVHGRLMHPFEAHGFLKAFQFDSKSGQVKLTAKYINTPVRKLEETFRAPLFRGSMSSVADPSTWWGRLRNVMAPCDRETANLAVRSWNGKLLASSDNSDYYGLDPTTLETQGQERMNKALEGYKMLAHTRVDPTKDHLVSVACEYQPMEQTTTLTFFEFDKEGNLVSKYEHKNQPAVIAHDFTLTPHYYVVPAAKTNFDLSKFPDLLSGKVPATETFKIDDKAPATVLLIPRNGEGPVLQASMEDARHASVFHMGPSHEEFDAEGNVKAVVCHPCAFDQYQFGNEGGYDAHAQNFDPTRWSKSNGGSKLEAWRIEVPAQQSSNEHILHTTMTSRRISDIVTDMPTSHPGREGGDVPSRYVYTLGAVRPEGWCPFNAVVRHDLQTGGEPQIWPPQAAARLRGESDWDGGDYVRSEPLFVPKADSDVSDEDEGFVLSTCHSAGKKTTTLEVYDAQHIDQGPVLEVDLGELWGWNVHSSFAPTP